jgi:ketosteroid isomerase-like protein
VKRFWDDLFSSWDEYQVEPLEFEDLGDQVSAVCCIHARSARGIELDELWSALFTLRDGKIIRFQGFADQHGAREAAGPTR